MTLRDVARELGVSHMTVSNAYNRPEKLSEELRRRVLDTARRLGYQGPDPLAAGLVKRQAGALGVLFDEDLPYALTDPAALLFLQGVARAGQNFALGLTLLPAPRTTDDEESAAHAARSALVDGFVVYSVSAEHPGFLAARRRGIPLVVVDEPEPTTRDEWSFLGVDDRGGAYTAARHLTDLGHRRIAILADRLTPGADHKGPVDSHRLAATTYQVARRRLDGYLAALTDAGIAPSTVPIWECAGGTPEHATTATRELLTGDPDTRVTAIIAMTDELARGVLRTADAMRIHVPHDLSVIGFDDVPEAARTRPPLTTIQQPLHDKGALAVELLTQHPQPPIQKRLPTRLITRATTAPPNA